MNHLVGENKKCVLCGCGTQRLFTTAWVDEKRNNFVRNNSNAFASMSRTISIRFYLCSECITLSDHRELIEKKVRKFVNKKLNCNKEQNHGDIHSTRSRNQ